MLEEEDEVEEVEVAMEEEEGCGFTDSASSLSLSTASYRDQMVYEEKWIILSHLPCRLVTPGSPRP